MGNRRISKNLDTNLLPPVPPRPLPSRLPADSDNGFKLAPPPDKEAADARERGREREKAVDLDGVEEGAGRDHGC